MNNVLYDQLNLIAELDSSVEFTQNQLSEKLACLEEIRIQLSEDEKGVTADMLHNAALANEWLNGKLLKIDQTMRRIESVFRAIHSDLALCHYKNARDVSSMLIGCMGLVDNLGKRMAISPTGEDVIIEAINASFFQSFSGELKTDADIAIISIDSCRATVDVVFAFRYRLTICDYRTILYRYNEIAKLANN